MEAALRQSELQLRQAQKMEAVGRLAGGVAHDFNNLLTVIMGHSQVLLSEMGTEDPQRNKIEEMQKAGERATALIRQLLAFSRKQPSEPKVLDVNAVLTDIESMMRRLVGADIDLVLKLSPEPLRVTAEPSQLEQIVINLAVNGRDAMPASGPLTIETHNLTRAVAPGPGRADMPVGDVAALIVRDEGSGMSQGIVMRLFEPFFTTKPPGRGTGLGLATVHGVVKQHHGHIEVDTAVGFGSTFGVLFPRTEDVILHHGIRTGDMAFLAKIGRAHV